MAPVDVNFRNNVQGDLFSRGFPKIHETYYFFSIVQETVFPQKLADLGKSTEISSVTKVLGDWKKVDATPKGEIIDLCNALIAFSMKGLRKIQAGLGGNDLEVDKIDTSDPAFAMGMKEDGPGSLNDPPFDQWDKLFRQEHEDIHGLLKVAGSDPTIINTKLHKIKAILGHGTVIKDIASSSEPTIENSRVDGQVRPKDQRLNGREHFGFEDAISQPLLEGIDDLDRPTFYGKDVLMHTEQEVITVAKPPPGSHPKPEAQGNPFKRPKWMVDGSFLVFRKLEQDVAGFNEFLEQNHAKANCANAALFGAKVMGRWPSGAPVMLFPEKDTATDPKGDNTFTFTDNYKCPMAAHIRKMNPRDEKLEFALNARIIRNGIPYGKEYSEAPNTKRGLLFACYQSSIGNGFRFLQIAWANKDSFPKDNAGYDLIVAQRKAPEKLTCNFEDKDHKVTTISDIPSLVTMRGGEYFFVPSISALTSKLGKA